MPLINSTTDFNKLKYTSSGGDRWDQGKSGQPYIVKPIPGADDTFEQQLDGQPQSNGGVDFLLRGGLKAVNAALTDVSRLTQMLFDTKSPNGFEFIAKQNVLSRNNVKTESSFGLGYAGGALNQGIYTPVGTLLQAGVGFLGANLNLFGLDPTSPMTGVGGDSFNGFFPSTGLNTYFSTINQQNLTNDIEDSNRLVNLNNAVNTNTSSQTLRGNITLNPGGDIQTNVLEYGGGPGSILGIGDTRIPFADQRTGLLNAKLPKVIPFINPDGPNDYSVYGIRQYQTGTAIPNGGFVDGSQVAKGNLFVSGSGVTGTFADIYPDFDGYGLIEGLALNLGSNKYIDQPAGSIYSFNNSVYAGLEGNDRLTSNDLKLDIRGTRVLTQDDLYSIPVASETGLTNVADFRTKIIKDFGLSTAQDPNAVSSVLSISPSYVTKNKQVRVNQGDPGKGSDLGVKNVLHYGVAANTLQAIDKINALKMYESTVVDLTKATNDFVKFRIAVINNDKADGTATYIHFRALIDGFSDAYTAKWDSVQYVGRGEELYNYKGFGRDISMDFTVYAQSKAELIPMYKKLNYLASTLAPDYNPAGFMRGNLVRLTVGGYLYEQAGIIKSLTYTVPMESTWEIAINETGGNDESVKELPHMIKVTGMSFTPIQSFVPAKADSLEDPTQKYIALANSSGRTNYEDTYAIDYLQQGSNESNAI
tara:strand:+ start:4622 stop:6727 length:2106 start_codon:yes stop_codon:yes gene_type:complete